MFALIILVYYKKPLPVDWLMVITTSVVFVSCMAVSFITPYCPKCLELMLFHSTSMQAFSRQTGIPLSQ